MPGCRVLFQSGTLRRLADRRVVRLPAKQKCRRASMRRYPAKARSSRSRSTSQLGHAAQIADDFKTRVPVARAPLFAPPAVAAAIDIGTTTVAILLAEVETGKILAALPR